ncbi:nuclear transport factor 2 family protein [Flavobacterium sp. LS1R49]|uniref:Nuclear transport factor 2 family protein n=1 Tax=Flavobacterium shii TaxID=2987687 RepID=A0A9X3C6R0_9FLAO|nr:nuclear transport factor 2 family protein [Flavobacterium shii]MCV9930027.1 nuclear transport factor 2 family protein [Flavobacterium shii]
MKKSILLLLFITSFAQAQTSDTDKINKTLNSWHKAAADASFEPYFALMTDDAIFIGTDATENWNKADFKVWAKPFFDKGKTWNFKTLERHVFFDVSGKTAWFDELLDTQMKICRGSGVMVKVGKEWKVKHYVLSMTVPNDNVDDVVKIKAPAEDVIIEKFHKK